MGRVLVLAGLVAGLSGLWMTVRYPRTVGDGLLLVGVRLVFAGSLVACMTLGYVTAVRRDFAAHRAWMIRGHTINIGARTQALLCILWTLAKTVSPVKTEAITSCGAAGRSRRGRHG